MISLDIECAMSSPVQTVTVECSAVEAAQQMRADGVGALVVLDETGAIDGIVTQSDIIGLLAAEAEMATTTVADLMSSPVVSIGSDDPILAAAELMKDHSVRRLPVVDDGELVGIVTTTDLTHYLPRLRNTILRNRKEPAAAEAEQ
ncbi:cyclic nucleotide-binding/CBS domain-containing protein [Salinibaculum salinum]|uniref:CBS domain-containing protein n=1 Tax=Salinibaculum salinum TaxID=3131996 RepID=UPI0030EDF780